MQVQYVLNTSEVNELKQLLMSIQSRLLSLNRKLTGFEKNIAVEANKEINAVLSKLPNTDKK